MADVGEDDLGVPATDHGTAKHGRGRGAAMSFIWLLTRAATDLYDRSILSSEHQAICCILTRLFDVQHDSCDAADKIMSYVESTVSLTRYALAAAVIRQFLPYT